MTATMNIYFHFPANAGTFALPAIKSVGIMEMVAKNTGVESDNIIIITREP